jgi:hypothetical protein
LKALIDHQTKKIKGKTKWPNATTISEHKKQEIKRKTTWTNAIKISNQKTLI